jgi:hypothetical protein
MPDNQRPDDAEHIDLNLEDLDAEPLPAAPGRTPSGDTLFISAEDLADVPEAPSYPAAYPAAAPVAGLGYEKGKQGAVASFVGNLMLQMAIAGALGGLLAWAINEPRILALERHLEAPGGGRDAASIYLSTMLFTLVMGGVLGLFLGMVEGLSSGNWRRAGIGGGLGLAIGAVGGGIAGFLAQLVYGVLGGQGTTVSLAQIIARSIGWGIAGLFIGLAQGAATRSAKKIVNGMCGGALGGFIGGFLFDPIALFMTAFGQPGTASRLIAQVVIGLASGAAIGLIEEWRKEAWVVVISGLLTGKQFILYRATTTIGSSPKCDLALLKDPAIAPQHCVIEMAGPAWVLRDLGAPGGTSVNGRPVQRHNLRRGDVIQVGQTALEFQDRALAPRTATPS